MNAFCRVILFVELVLILISTANGSGLVSEYVRLSTSLGDATTPIDVYGLYSPSLPTYYPLSSNGTSVSYQMVKPVTIACPSAFDNSSASIHILNTDGTPLVDKSFRTNKDENTLVGANEGVAVGAKNHTQPSASETNLALVASFLVGCSIEDKLAFAAKVNNEELKRVTNKRITLIILKLEVATMYDAKGFLVDPCTVNCDEHSEKFGDLTHPFPTNSEMLSCGMSCESKVCAPNGPTKMPVSRMCCVSPTYRSYPFFSGTPSSSKKKSGNGSHTPVPTPAPTPSSKSSYYPMPVVGIRVYDGLQLTGETGQAIPNIIDVEAIPPKFDPSAYILITMAIVVVTLSTFYGSFRSYKRAIQGSQQSSSQGAGKKPLSSTVFNEELSDLPSAQSISTMQAIGMLVMASILLLGLYFLLKWGAFYVIAALNIMFGIASVGTVAMVVFGPFLRVLERIGLVCGFPRWTQIPVICHREGIQGYARENSARMETKRINQYREDPQSLDISNNYTADDNNIEENGYDDRMKEEDDLSRAIEIKTPFLNNGFFFFLCGGDSEDGGGNPNRLYLGSMLSLSLGWILVSVWLVGTLTANAALVPWVWQNILGFSIICVVQALIHVPNLSVGTYLLSAFFCYDVFMVFISPLIFSSSVMMDVATAGKGSTIPSNRTHNSVANDTLAVCHRSPSITMPMVFMIPRFSFPYGGGTNSYSLLGFGDLIIPGLLLTFFCRYDWEVYRKPTYWPLMIIGYAAGLVMAFLANYFHWAPPGVNGQPALLYLVPFTVIPGILLSKRWGDFQDMWNGPQAFRKKRHNHENTMTNNGSLTIDPKGKEDNNNKPMHLGASIDTSNSTRVGGGWGGFGGQSSGQSGYDVIQNLEDDV